MKPAKNKQLFGIIYTTGSLQVAEMISLCGFEWVMIDMEHSAMSLETVQRSLQVLGNNILRIVRVPGNDDVLIKRVLDTGCDGIMVPMVKTREEAEKAILASKYPPEGRRSVGLTRAHGYGQSSGDYLSSANRDLVIMLQIEHIEAVRNIDSILGVKGIDSVFIGPYDLSASMDLLGQVTHPEVLKTIDLIKKKCSDADIPYGIFGAGPDIVSREIKDGCRFILCGVDVSLFSATLKDLSDSMDLLGQVTHPEVLKTIDLIKKKCGEAGIPYGIFGAGPDMVSREIKDGCRFILCGIDVSLFSATLKDLSEKLHGLA